MPASETDLDLLRRYIDADDADAFAGLVRRHTSLVYHTCLRVLGDRERAEDAAQETFHRLMRNPEKVNHCLPAWLHRVATRLSIDVLRSDGARRRRESAYQRRLEQRRTPEPWAEVSMQIDEALHRLNESDRALLVEHFLNEKTQASLAREAGVSKATMCRRMESALRALRKNLGEASGVAGVSVAALALGLTTIAGRASAAVPPTLTAELNKMALVSGGSVGTGAAVGVGTGLVTVHVAPLTALLGLLGLAGVGVIILLVIQFDAEAIQGSEARESVSTIRNAIVEPPETAPPADANRTVYLRTPGESLRADHAVAYIMDQDQVSIVFGDTHVRTMPLEEARPLIEKQAGQTLEQLAARSAQP